MDDHICSFKCRTPTIRASSHTDITRGSSVGVARTIAGPAAAPRCRHRLCYLDAYADANVCVVAAPSSLCCCSARGRISAPSGRGAQNPRQGKHPPRFSSISSCFPSTTGALAPSLRVRRQGWPASLGKKRVRISILELPTQVTSSPNRQPGSNLRQRSGQQLPESWTLLHAVFPRQHVLAAVK